MTVDEVRTHIRYSHWASRRLMAAAAELSEEDRSRGVGVSHSSIAQTLGHIYLADRIWYTRVAAPEMPLVKVAPWETLGADWTDLQAKWEVWADALQSPDLDRVVSYRSLSGDPFETPLQQIVLHVVNHATLHRGQVMAMIRQLGVTPPGTDLIFYYRELAAAAKAS